MPARGFALTYIEVLFLTRESFMRVIERRKPRDRIFHFPDFGRRLFVGKRVNPTKGEAHANPGHSTIGEKGPPGTPWHALCGDSAFLFSSSLFFFGGGTFFIADGPESSTNMFRGWGGKAEAVCVFQPGPFERTFVSHVLKLKGTSSCLPKGPLGEVGASQLREPENCGFPFAFTFKPFSKGGPQKGQTQLDSRMRATVSSGRALK